MGDRGSVKVVGVAGRRDVDGHRVVLTVVNRSPDAAISTVVTVGRPIASSGAVVHLVQGPSPEARNSFAQPDLVTVQTHTLSAGGTALELTFPPHSFSCVELPLQ